MKMYYNGTPIKSMNIKHYELNTNDCTAIPSDLQSGVTCVSKGQKITGTGKAFSFASYGRWKTNYPNVIPTMINTIQIGSIDYPIRMVVAMTEMPSLNFSSSQNIAEVIIDGVTYPIIVSVENNVLTVTCDQTIDIELFMGRDEYVL